MIGTLLSWAAALAFCAIGLGALLAPRLSAGQYGLPTADPAALPFVRALGIRDIVLGLLVAGFAFRNEAGPLAWTLAICALAGAGDFAIVSRAAGEHARSLPVHAGGTIGLLAAAGMVAAGR